MNRRAFLALTPVAAVGGITTLLASPSKPHVQIVDSWQGDANSQLPHAFPYTLIDGMPVGASMMVVANAGRAAIPMEAVAAAHAWGQQNTPQGFHVGQSNIIGLAGLIVCVIGICVMGFIFYWLWKWASTLLPPVDQQTNASPNDPYPAARGAQ